MTLRKTKKSILVLLVNEDGAVHASNILVLDSFCGRIHLNVMVSKCAFSSSRLQFLKLSGKGTCHASKRLYL